MVIISAGFSVVIMSSSHVHPCITTIDTGSTRLGPDWVVYGLPLLHAPAMGRQQTVMGLYLASRAALVTGNDEQMLVASIPGPVPVYRGSGPAQVIKERLPPGEADVVQCYHPQHLASLGCPLRLHRLW